jgi:hypothetical protein
MTDALLLLLLAALASVHLVLLVIRARHTAEMLRRAASVTPGTADVQSDTAGAKTRRRRWSMHGHAGSLCTASDRLAASLLASVRNTTSGSGVEAPHPHMGYLNCGTTRLLNDRASRMMSVPVSLARFGRPPV